MSRSSRNKDKETVCCPHKPQDFLLVGQKKREVKAQPQSNYEPVRQNEDLKQQAGSLSSLFGSRLALPAPLQAEGSAAASSLAFIPGLGPRAPAPHGLAGEKRKKLRHDFNKKELETAQLIQKYDKNGNKVLEKDELETLLHDYNGRRKPKPDDIQFFLAVADADNDGSISQHEILAGISAWYALNNMPKEVGRALGKHKIGSGPMPSAEQLKEFLEVINDSLPVTDEDVAHVLKLARALGATENKATLDQMRRATAAWYIDVERDSLTNQELHSQTVGGLWGRFLKDLTVFQGNIDLKSKPARMMLYALIFCGLILPVSDLLIATEFPTNYSCEHPHLSGLLWWGSISTMILMVTGILTSHTFADNAIGQNNALKPAIRFAFAAVCVIQAMIAMFGATHVTSSSSMRCGFLLWYAAQITFVMQPLILILGICIGIPVLYFEVYHECAALDSELQDHHEGHHA